MPQGVWRQEKYEAELDPHFAEEVASIPGGEKLYSCIQCGTCSAACPVSQYMDYTPRKIISMIRAGFKKEVLSSTTPWLCVSCYACTVECPKKVTITDIMYAAKRLGIREGIYPKKFMTPVLAREFFDIVKKNGRNHEPTLLTRMYLKTNPFRMFKQMTLGMKLFIRGRMSVKKDVIERKGELQTVLKALEKETMIKARPREHVTAKEME